MNAARPVSILVAALGGEGGGVLADWIVSAATAEGYPVQSTSVPGVAQRTGATTYYIEIFPVRRAELGGREPVLALTPSPGDVTLVAASELVEAGRMLQAGYVAPGRTTLIASTHREYSVAEKSAMGDGRYDEQRILRAAEAASSQRVLFDMRSLALRHRTVINTVIFGAMAGSGALPLSRQACEDAIRASGKAVEASLKGFAAGFAAAAEPAGEFALASAPAAGLAAAADPAVAPGEPPTAPAPAAAALPRSARRHRLAERLAALPADLADIAVPGVRQTLDYQNAGYAALYLDRVESLAAQAAGGGQTAAQACREAARYLALWMSYEDVIRVADLKTRRSRLERVRAEVGAGGEDVLHVTEFLKPGLDEICSVLPGWLAARVRRRLASRAHRLNVGLQLRTTTVGGFALLCLLRSLRPWRPRTSRYAAEQAMIGRWLDAVHEAMRRSPDLALEIALCGNLVKGYGETSERGHRNLAAILADLDARASEPPAELTERVRKARKAALADPEGRALAGALDLPEPPMVVKPVHFVRRKPKGGNREERQAA